MEEFPLILKTFEETQEKRTANIINKYLRIFLFCFTFSA